MKFKLCSNCFKLRGPYAKRKQDFMIKSKFVLILAINLLACSLVFANPLATEAVRGQQKVACVEQALPGARPAKGLKLYGGKNSVLDVARRLVGMKAMSEPDWTEYLGEQFHDEKVAAIYSAAEKVDMPPTVLAGSILQESSAADLGIGRDFDNWTCGPSQFSVIGWCQWAEAQDAETQNKIGWPRQVVSEFKSKNPDLDICAENSFLAREHLRPFFEIAMARMQKETHIRQEYMLQPHFLTSPSRIQFEQVQNQMGQISSKHGSQSPGQTHVEELRFYITRSFAENCSNHKYAFQAMAFMLRDIFMQLPQELREAQQVPELSSLHGNPLYRCEKPVMTKAYPLHVGWLLADAIYNAGPSLAVGVLDYQKTRHIPWEQFSPKDLIAAIDYAISPKFGMWGIGPEEAKGHLRGVLSALQAGAGD